MQSTEAAGSRQRCGCRIQHGRRVDRKRLFAQAPCQGAPVAEIKPQLMQQREQRLGGRLCPVNFPGIAAQAEALQAREACQGRQRRICAETLQLQGCEAGRQEAQHKRQEVRAAARPALRLGADTELCNDV